MVLYREPHLSISPLQHILNGQLGAIYRRGFPPHGQSQKKYDNPKGEDDFGAGPNALRPLWRRLLSGHGGCHIWTECPSSMAHRSPVGRLVAVSDSVLHVISLGISHWVS